MRSSSRRLVVVAAVLLLPSLLVAWGGASGESPTSAATIGLQRSPTTEVGSLGPVPTLPFVDNPDPTQCGIPQVWRKVDPAWITGWDQGKLIEPKVALYDSHMRHKVVGWIPDGGRVKILLVQTNPVLDFYQVRSLDLANPQTGWVPAPFLSMSPPSS